MNSAVTVIGTAILSLLLAGYFAQQYLPPPKPRVVGIDLGTTYSCVAVYESGTGNVRVIPIQEKHKTIPSVVAFRDKDVIVGYDAQDQAESNPHNTIYDAKRFIGRKISPEELIKASQGYQFEIVSQDGMAEFLIGPPDNQTKITPEYIGSQIVYTLRLSAEANLSVPVTRCVLAVPAEFNELQRNYTAAAAELAGLEVLRVITEPTAAAMAYGLHKKEGVSLIAVVDIGGGTSDVALLRIQGGMFLTQALAGNNYLGGQDFNRRLLKHVQKKLNWHSPSSEDIQVLHTAVEKAKLELATSPWTEINLQSLQKRKHLTSNDIETTKDSINDENKLYRYNITRLKFEELNQDLFQKVTLLLDAVIKDAGVESDEIDEIVLVGGSTRIPYIRKLIGTYFSKEPNTAIDPELAVVYGVAIQAGILGGAWPLQVAAVELPIRTRKRHLN